MNERGLSKDQPLAERVRQALDGRRLDWNPETVLDVWREVFMTSPINIRTALLQYQTDGQLGLVDMAPENMVSRQMARSMAATERVWGTLEGEFGLFTAEEALKKFGPSATCLNQAAVDQGSVIGVVRRGKLRFPGFQLDPPSQARLDRRGSGSPVNT